MILRVPSSILDKFTEHILKHKRIILSGQSASNKMNKTIKDTETKNTLKLVIANTVGTTERL